MENRKEGYTKTKVARASVKTTDGQIFSARIYLGNMNRVSDLFTKGSEPFVTLVDVEPASDFGRVLIVNKKHIVWVQPEEDNLEDS